MRIGNLYATRSIDELMQENKYFRDELNQALGKFINNDWGITCDEDVLLNNLAVETGERIVAVYNTCKGKIWIISEYERTATTILFPSEY